MISGFCQHLSDTVVQVAKSASSGLWLSLPPPPRFLNNFNDLKRIRQSDSFENLFRRLSGDGKSYFPVYAPIYVGIRFLFRFGLESS